MSRGNEATPSGGAAGPSQIGQKQWESSPRAGNNIRYGGSPGTIKVKEDWRKALQPASYRGVVFHVDSITTIQSRKYALHDFPSVPWKTSKGVTIRETVNSIYTDLGKNLPKYTISAYVLGRDYMSRRDSLMIALTEFGEAGLFKHPRRGKKEQMCYVIGEVNCVESKAEGGYAHFSFTLQAAAPEIETKPAKPKNPAQAEREKNLEMLRNAIAVMNGDD